MNRNQSDNLPVAEIIECNVMGQQTIQEIEGRLKYLKIGDKLYTQPIQAAQRSLTGSEQNVLHKALLRTGRVVTYRPPITEEFDKALKKHETNCCMFERGAQTLDDLLRSREEFIKSVQSI